MIIDQIAIVVYILFYIIRLSDNLPYHRGCDSRARITLLGLGHELLSLNHHEFHHGLSEVLLDLGFQRH